MPPISCTSKSGPRCAPERLANRGEGLEDHLFERLSVLDALPELGGLPRQLVIRQSLELGLERADVRGLLVQAFEATPLAHAQDLSKRPPML